MLRSTSLFMSSLISRLSSFWHERAAFQSVGVRVADWQRRFWPLKMTLFSIFSRPRWLFWGPDGYFGAPLAAILDF